MLAWVALLAGFGCARKEPGSAAAGGHEHHAPHGGVLVELGGHQASLELRFDGTRGVLQAWLLDAHAENFVRTDQPGFEIEARAGGAVHAVRFVAVANAMTGETVGDTATFEAPADWLRAAKAFDGRVKAITVRGVTFQDVPFKFSEHEAHAP